MTASSPTIHPAPDAPPCCAKLLPYFGHEQWQIPIDNALREPNSK